MALDEVKYLGQAVRYPVTLVSGRPLLAAGKDAVEQALIVLLNTPVGTRFFLPEYGSRTNELIFEINDEVLESLLDAFIFEAINNWEKRVKCLSVDFERGDDYINCTVTYKILASNEINSFIYPFYSKLVN